MSGTLCPTCRAPLDRERPVCAAGHRFEVRDGVLVLLDPERAAALEAFSIPLRRYREAIGRRLPDAETYPRLPHGEAKRDPEWRRRVWDLDVVTSALAAALPVPDALSVLDVGSHNGWLSHHLSRDGHDVTAVDYFDDPYDGLRARRFYPDPRWRSIQLDLTDLALLGRRFDAVVLNRCLQFFPDPHAYLEHAKERVAPGGLMVITGLDLHRDAREKREAVERLRADYRRRYGRDLFLHETRGYLDWDDRRRLLEAGVALHPYRQQWLRNLAARLRPTRPSFGYGVWRHPDRRAD